VRSDLLAGTSSHLVEEKFIIETKALKGLAVFIIFKEFILIVIVKIIRTKKKKTLNFFGFKK